MTTKRRIIQYLEEKSGEYISGQRIANHLNISRSAVWKVINSLESEGYIIEAAKNRGYRLLGIPDDINKKAIATYLENQQLYKIKVFDTLDSTNTALMKAANEGEPHGSVYVARSQLCGKGRLGRQFHSQSRNGLYFSILLRPNLAPENAAFLTTLAAVAVCRAIEKLSDAKPQIKWVNDVFVNGKKVCGILTQASMSFEAQLVEYAVVGIGINIIEPIEGFRDDIKNIAGAVFKNSGDCIKSQLLALVLDEFAELYDKMSDKYYIMEQYRSRCFVIGKQITAIRGNDSFEGVVEGIDDDCALILKRKDNSTIRLVSGEISIRL